MSNVCGKAYGLTAMTRMNPLKTYGLRAVFAAITVSLMPPATAAAIAVGAAAPIVVAVIDLALRVFVWSSGLTDVSWLRVRPFLLAGSLLGLHGWAAAFAGIFVITAAFAIIGAGIGGIYQPSWTILGKIRQIQLNLTDLSFIHYARWVIIRKDQFPRLSSSQPTERLQYDYLLFESNFNGDWEKYIDAFSDVVPGGMDNIWRWSVRYPYSRPITPFLDYIRNCQYDTDHYYSAYPGASTNDVRGALALQAAFDRFVLATASMSPDEFAAAYARFTVQVQNFLATTGAPPFPARARPGRTPSGSDIQAVPPLQSAST